MSRTLLCFLWIGAGCASSRVLIVRGGAASPPPPSPPVQLPTAAADSGHAGELLKHSVFAPLRSLFNSPGLARKMVRMRAEAYNLTAADDVDDSNWFVGRRDGGSPIPPAAGPDTSAGWTLVSLRSVAGPPVMVIRDAQDREYWLTFDAPAFPDVATAGELIAARLYSAAGYHTPAVTLVTFDPARRLAGDSTTVAVLMGQVARGPDGRVRAAAHRVAGRHLGPFAFAGRRSDDPTDSVPHEHRRELRGLYVVAAWLNHWGLFRGVTLDALVDSAGRGVMRHHLADFASSLSAGERAAPRAGTEAAFDAGKIAKRLVTFGFYAAAWERSAAPRFDPAGWTPSYPNPAFARRTVRDAFWGAKLVARISAAQVRAAVTAGQLSDSTAAHALVETLLERRDLTLRHWFARVTPLDDLAVTQSPAGIALSFRDLAVAEGLLPSRRRTYEIRVSVPALRVSHRDSVTLHLTEDGRGAVGLPAAGRDGAIDQLPVEQRVGWIEVGAVPDAGDRPRWLRIYVLPDTAAGYRIVGRRY